MWTIAAPETVKIFPDTGQIVLPLEEFVLPAPAFDADNPFPASMSRMKTRSGRTAKRSFIRRIRAGIDPLGALIGDRREVIPVEDDDLARFQGGIDIPGDVLPAVLDKEVEFFLGGQGIGRRAFFLIRRPHFPVWVRGKKPSDAPGPEPPEGSRAWVVFPEPSMPSKTIRGRLSSFHGVSYLDGKTSYPRGRGNPAGGRMNATFRLPAGY